MANQAHLNLLRQSVEDFNTWRVLNPTISPDLREANLAEADLRDAHLAFALLSGADLRAANLERAYLIQADLRDANLAYAHLANADLFKANIEKASLHKATLIGAQLMGAGIYMADLREADLRKANLYKATLIGVKLMRADLTEANLLQAILDASEVTDAKLVGADLTEASLVGVFFINSDLRGCNLRKANLGIADLTNAKLREADLREADLTGVNLRSADLTNAKLSRARLDRSILIETILEGADLSGCHIYGISAWDLSLKDTVQKDLVITPKGQPYTTADDLEVAQFIYLLLRNEKIRDVIDTIGKKGVLILGRFTEERKEVLDAIRDRLRELGFVPMMFDFERATQRDFTETIKTLAGLSRFIVADITNPKSSPLELQATMPDYMIPFVPIIQEDEEPFAMFRDLQQKYGKWVLDVLEYDSAPNLLGVLDKAVVRPALVKADQLIRKKAEAIRKRHIRDYQ